MFANYFHWRWISLSFRVVIIWKIEGWSKGVVIDMLNMDRISFREHVFENGKLFQVQINPFSFSYVYMSTLQGCDASVLLDGSASGPSEQDAPPNLTLRASAFEIINELRAKLDEKCGRVVSCADIAALAARDSVYLVISSTSSNPSINLSSRSFPLWR